MHQRHVCLYRDVHRHILFNLIKNTTSFSGLLIQNTIQMIIFLLLYSSSAASFVQGISLLLLLVLDTKRDSFRGLIKNMVKEDITQLPTHKDLYLKQRFRIQLKDNGVTFDDREYCREADTFCSIWEHNTLIQ
eukprot:GAHX01001796.1.p1 GENE.GAHX01001796.1~~GAHX01001796.1.p1  ORF type:complete len:133 (-),score=5.70 GAHX01001796.1:412-810(-)